MKKRAIRSWIDLCTKSMTDKEKVEFAEYLDNSLEFSFEAAKIAAKIRPDLYMNVDRK